MKQPIGRVQIYGERNSGTNYLQHLMERNFCNLKITWQYGWKHFLPEGPIEQADDCLFLVIHRNPFDWLRSMHKKPHHAALHLRELGISEFIRAEWFSVFDESSNHFPGEPSYGQEMMIDRDHRTGQRFAHLLALRSSKIEAWNGLRGRVRHLISLRYEDIKAAPHESLAKLADRFGLRSQPAFQDVIEAYGVPGTRYTPTPQSPISRKDVDFILGELDCALEVSIGYDLNALAASLHTFALSGMWQLAIHGLRRPVREVLRRVHRRPACLLNVCGRQAGMSYGA